MINTAFSQALYRTNWKFSHRIGSLGNA